MDEKEILASGAKRAEQLEAPYVAALLPQEAHKLAEVNRLATIVDVRTRPELQFVGRVPDAVELEWQSFPDMDINQGFVEQLSRLAPDKDAPLMFLCRSGVRSHLAAMVATEAGWTKACNILEGFEGDLDTNGHRSAVGGWKFRGLPWIQS